MDLTLGVGVERLASSAWLVSLRAAMSISCEARGRGCSTSTRGLVALLTPPSAPRGVLKVLRLKVLRLHGG